MTDRFFHRAILFIPIAATLLFGQAPPAAVVDIPVWVYDGGRFVDGLTLDDFEIYEDGILQPPGSLRLIEEQAVVREEVRHPSSPSLQRHFYLLFQTADWDPKLGEAVDYLFRSLLRPGDTLTLVTPMKPYSLAQDALARKPKEALSREMQQILRKDIQRGGGDYRQALRDLRRIVGAIGGDRLNLESDMESDAAGTSFGLEMQLSRYKQGLRKLETMRLIDGKRLIEFAESLKGQPGRHFVFFFYQREFRPEISGSSLALLMDMYQDVPNIRGDLQDLFQYYRRDQSLDAASIRRAFADASITFSFIFMNKESQYLFGANMREQSEDIFPLFSGVAAATGGRAYSSQNPAASLRAAAEAAGRYYLLTYTPSRPAGDGGFRTIEVKVAGRDLSLSCRAGYYAK